MKPSWEKLTEVYQDHPTVLVATVDCTAGGGDLCRRQKANTYPTIKYGDPRHLQVYHGARKFEDFREFARNHLGPLCAADNTDALACDEVQKSQLEELALLEASDLLSQITMKEAAIADADLELQKVQEKEKMLRDNIRQQKEERVQKITSDPHMSASNKAGLEKHEHVKYRAALDTSRGKVARQEKIAVERIRVALASLSLLKYARALQGSTGRSNDL